MSDMEPSEMVDAKPPRPGWTQPGIHGFPNAYLYIIDDCDPRPPAPSEDLDPDDPAAQPRKPSKHEENVWAIRLRFEKYTNCEVIGVRIAESNSDHQALHKYFVEELKSRSEEDLLLFYFHGAGISGGTRYSWKFSGHTLATYNAYDIFKLFGQSRCACMFLLDCDINTIWEHKLPEPEGHVSIIARGGQPANIDGTPVDDAACFTASLLNNMWDYAMYIDDKTKEQPFGHKGKQDVQTISQMMAISNRPLYHTLHRIDKLYRQPTSSPKMDIVIDPKKIRENFATMEKLDPRPKRVYGQIEFFLHVTGSAKESRSKRAVKATTAPASPKPKRARREASVASVADSGFHEEESAPSSQITFKGTLADFKRLLWPSSSPNP